MTYMQILNRLNGILGDCKINLTTLSNGINKTLVLPLEAGLLFNLLEYFLHQSVRLFKKTLPSLFKKINIMRSHKIILKILV